MAKGKQTCKILKEIRKQIAEENDIELVISECTYKGDCQGTCPKCEEEVRYLERELEKRQRMGKVAVLAGVSLGTMFAATSCDSTQSMPEKGTLRGDVTAEMVEPATPEIDPDSIVEPPLMGIVPYYRNFFPFDEEVYQKSLKELFALPEMEGLSVLSGRIFYGHIADGNECNSLEKLIAEAKEFKMPSYCASCLDMEKKMLEDISAGLEERHVNANRAGMLEIAFTVTQGGDVEEAEIVKGINSDLDAAMVDLFQQMKWVPAEYLLKDGSGESFECRCVKKIKFPIK